MRIGMVLDTSFPPDPRVENEAVSLIEAGHEVYLFSLCYKSLTREENINGIKVRRYPANQLIYQLSALAYSLPFYHKLVYPKIQDFLIKYKIEVIHIHDMVIAQAVFDVNKNLKLPVVLDLHENRPAIMQYYRHVKSFWGRLLINLKKWEKKQKEFMEKADKVILVTEEAKAAFVSKYNLPPDKIISVPNTTVLDLFYSYPVFQDIINRFSGSFSILYLGDTGIRRGTDTAIKAVALLKNKIHNLKLILVGKSKEDVLLKELAINLKIENLIAFEGWQDLSTFPSYIKASDVCISPLKRNIHHDTTYANKIFQYMAMGKPLVVSNCAAQAKVIEKENCGLIHEAENEHDLAEKLFFIYANPDKKAEFGENSKEATIIKYNWKITSKELVDLYCELEKIPRR